MNHAITTPGAVSFRRLWFRSRSASALIRLFRTKTVSLGARSNARVIIIDHKLQNKPSRSRSRKSVNYRVGLFVWVPGLQFEMRLTTSASRNKSVSLCLFENRLKEPVEEVQARKPLTSLQEIHQGVFVAAVSNNSMNTLVTHRAL